MLLEPQLDLFSEVERKKVLLDRLIGEMEQRLSDLKFTYTQVTYGAIDVDMCQNARRHIREAQIELCKIMVILGIRNGIHRDRNFLWYWNNYVETYHMFSRESMPQQNLYEMVYYLGNKFVTMFAKYRELWQLFAANSVKVIEQELKLARLALK